LRRLPGPWPFYSTSQPETYCSQGWYASESHGKVSNVVPL
jgi:hypothetical protein